MSQAFTKAKYTEPRPIEPVEAGLLAQRELQKLGRHVKEETQAHLNLSVTSGAGSVEITASRPLTPLQRAYTEGSLHMERRDWVNAVEAFRRAVELEPSSWMLTMLGIAYSKMGDLSAAAQTFEEATRLDDQNAYAHLFLGTAHMLSGRLQEAVGPLRRAQELDPQESHASFYLGYVYSELEQWNSAIEAYNTEIENQPEYIEGYQYLVMLHEQLGQESEDEWQQHFLKAIEVYRKWAEVDPGNSDIYSAIGYLQNTLGNNEESIKALEEAVRAKDDNVIALSNLGTGYLQAERNEDARAIFTRLTGFDENIFREQLAPISVDPEEAVRLRIGEAYQKLGAADLGIYLSKFGPSVEAKADHPLLHEAETALKKALELNPEDTDSQHNLGNLYYLEKRRIDAIAAYRKVLATNPAQEDASNNLLAIRQELHREIGMALWERLQGSNQETPVPVEELARVVVEARARVFEGTDVPNPEEVFTSEDILSALGPAVEKMEPPGARFQLAAKIFELGWLSAREAAQLAGVGPIFFLMNLYRVGIGTLAVGENGMENEVNNITDPPLTGNVDGVIRVAGTRVTLDTVVGAFNDGATPEEIVQQYPSLRLDQVYAVVAYYLQHRPEVEAYLSVRQQVSDEVRKMNESVFPHAGIRERLLARREPQTT